MKRALTVGAVGATIVLCWMGAGVRPGALLEPANLRAVGGFVAGLFPPDLSAPFLGTVAAAIARTLAIAVAGTAISIALGLPLGILATASLWRRGPLIDSQPAGLIRRLEAAGSLGARALSRLLRSIPELVWALLFVVGFGLGPLPGALALGMAYAGVLGRVYADLFEAVAPGPPLAILATGASRLQTFVAAIWPQARGPAVAYTLYSLECCVRSAAVLGFVGAGGVGTEINLSMRLFEYGQVTTLLLAFVAVVLATDGFSRRVRRRLQRNVPQRRGLSLGLLVLIAVAFQQVDLQRLAAVPRLGRFLEQMFPPALTPSFLASLWLPIWQTLSISVVGTLLGIAIGVALGLPAASVLLLDQGDRERFRPLRVALHALSRTGLALLRSIPEMIWVLLCILAVGLGPFAGALALGLHTGGVLGKLYAETLEEVVPDASEELRALGASAWQRLIWGLWPQARETLLGYTFLRWETNLRVSTVVGFVGGGGIGLALYNDVQLGFYDRAATLVGVIYLMVACVDLLADRLRRKPGMELTSSL